MSAYLRLRLATVAALAIPPLLTGSVDNVAAGTGDLEVGSGDRDERTLPLLVTKGGSTLEGNGGTSLQLGQVQCSTGRDGHVLDDDGSAGSLALDGRGGSSERAGCTSVKATGSSRDKRTSAEKEGGKREGNHDVGSL
jgi:hypothetical protein